MARYNENDTRGQGAIERGLRGALAGIETGNDWNDRRQAQQIRQEQISEIERQKGVRSQLGALDRSDPLKWAQGARDVYAGAGDYKESMGAGRDAMALEDTARKQKLMENRRNVALFQQAVQENRLADAEALMPTLGMFGGAQGVRIKGYNRDSDEMQFVVPGKGGRSEIHKARGGDMLAGAFINANDEDAYKLLLEQRAKREENKHRALDRSAIRGTYNRWEVMQMRSPDGKGRGAAAAILRDSDGVWLRDDKGQKRLASAEELARLGGADTEATQIGPNMRAFQLTTKNLSGTDTPALMTQQLVDAGRDAATKDLVLALSQSPKTLQDGMAAVLAAADEGVHLTAQHLTAAGFSPEAARASYNAAQQSRSRRAPAIPTPR